MTSLHEFGRTSDPICENLAALTAGLEYMPPLFVRSLKPPPKGCCIYFLMRHGEIVYIGQSTRFLSRTGNHRQEKKIFDEVRYAIVPKRCLKFFEYSLIRIIRPKLNKSIPRDSELAKAKAEMMDHLERRKRFKTSRRGPIKIADARSPFCEFTGGNHE